MHAYLREGSVSRGVDEGDWLTTGFHPICANVLRDSTSFAGDDVGLANGIEQGGFACVEEDP